ncbi:MAG: hypothetical protein K6F95_02560 [Selenomonas sp.]|uniref:hypothetical protein n=1 Tax=Selenomonas sp. TaxID=2053611 RepID=UPI0025D99EC2|nr:hypothetical protein [Selenomonas sp.]MCR5756773.1 hypothetical protein [Selenomonas sp.]
MKVQICSQWMEDVFIPVRVKQFTKAAKLLGHSDFSAYAGGQDLADLVQMGRKSTERQVVAEWLDSRGIAGATAGVA